jgi:predicted nucleic acid-binding protein
MSTTRALLDTNIVIHREAGAGQDDNIGVLFSWLDRLHYAKCVHPLTVTEIRKHKDPKVLKAMLIKLSSYDLLRTVSPLTPELTDIISLQDKTDNDKDDSRLLNELANKRVDILITEDTHIHAKAQQLGLSNKVFSIETFLQKVIEENPDLTDYKVLSIKKELFGNIDLTDPFFDSFKADYARYAEWFTRKSDHIAYICKEKERIRAFLYLKIENEGENYSDIAPIFPKKKRLKIGALKVSLFGHYLGERLLKVVFDNALVNRVEEIYVTIFRDRPEQQALIHFLNDWGFHKYGIKVTDSGEEEVFVRDFNRKVDRGEPCKTFPFFSRHANFFLLPIWPQYHTELFPDSILRTESPANFVESEPHRNALRKVYISHSLNRELQTGDVIAFYRTGGFHKSVVTTLGIIEDVVTSITDVGELIRLCRSRSVMNDKEIERYWNWRPGSRPFLVNFLYTYSLPKRPTLAELIDLGVIADALSAPRGFTSISWDKFYRIIKASKSDENLIIN